MINMAKVSITAIETGMCRGQRPPLFCAACGKPMQKGERYIRIIMDVDGRRQIEHVHALEWGSTCSPQKLHTRRANTTDTSEKEIKWNKK